VTEQHDVLILVRMTNPISDLAHLDSDEIAAEGLATKAALRAERTPGARPVRVSPPRLRPAMIALAVAALVLIVIGVPVLLTWTTDEPPVVDEPAPTTVTSVATETTAPPPVTTVTTLAALPAIPDQILARADFPSSEGAIITAVSVGGPGLIAVGFTEESAGRDVVVDGAVWVSSDGLSWDMADRAPFRGKLIEDVAEGPNGIVAVGDGEYDGAAWHSPDGIRWTDVSTDALGGNDVQYLNQVVAGGPGFVAVGRNGSAAGVWTSPDGVTWSSVESTDFGSVQEPAEMFGVAAGPGGLVAVGSGGFDPDHWGLGFGGEPIVWISDDGVEWERLPVDTFGDPSTFFFESVEASDAGFFLESSRDDGLRMWQSVDGIVWEEVEPIPCEGDDPTAIMISEPFGTPCRGVGYLEAPESVEIESSVPAIFGDQVVVAGEDRGGLVVAIWVGPLNG
jgi:hypothetical protein